MWKTRTQKAPKVPFFITLTRAAKLTHLKQIASTVSNLLAKEEILEREREKSHLLKISEAIASVQNYKELLKLVYEIIQPIFPFDNSGIFIGQSNGQEIIEITDAEILSGTVSSRFTEAKVYGPFSVHDFTDQSWCHSNKPLITTLKEQVNYIKNPVCEKQFKIGITAGLNQMICGPLITGGQQVGAFYLISKQEGLYTEEKMGLFKSISDMLAVSLSNIISKEEIAEKEKEKSLLLEINDAVALITDKAVLFQTMMDMAKTYSPFDDAILVMLSQDKQFCNGMIEAKQSGETLYAKFDDLIPVLTPIRNTPAELLIKEDDFYIWNLAQMEQKFAAHPYLEMMRSRDLHYSLYLKVNWDANKQIGFLNFHFKTEKQIKEQFFKFYKSIAAQLAAALSNIISREDILAREKEKTKLLSVSESMAKVRDASNFFVTLDETLKSIFDFDGAPIIHLLDEEKINCGIYYSDELDTESNRKFMNGWNRGSHLLADDPIGIYLVEENKTLILNVKKCLARWERFPRRQSMIDLQLAEALVAPLHTAGNLNGFLVLWSTKEARFNESMFPLFQSIADQVALTFSNVRKNEEIQQNEKEIKNLNSQLLAQNAYLIEEVQEEYNFEEMIGQNKQFQEACNSIGLVAKTDSTVLILGETGTGKELVARAIHNISPRKNKPLIKINCAALPASLIESELFGHERGAFTGAIERRIGKFELAHGSTLFLDEVGELPLELQAKLLRALQEKEIERLGSNKTMQIDVRIIAATNRDLVKEVKEGKFRQDLYYRLHIFPVTLPPLRERKEDLPLLASHFIQKYSKKIGKNIQGLSHKAIEEMMSYSWPGNIRELEHIIERSVILCKTKLIPELHLPLTSKNRITASPNEFVIKTWEEQERDYILEVLKVTKGNMAGKGGAAELLQLPPATLQSKMKKLGIKRMHYVEKGD